MRASAGCPQNRGADQAEVDAAQEEKTKHSGVNV